MVLVALKFDGIISATYFPPTLLAIFSLSTWTLKGLSALLFYTRDGEVLLPYRDLLSSISSVRSKDDNQTRMAYIKRYLVRLSCYLSAVILFQMRDQVPKWAFFIPIAVAWGISFKNSLKPEVKLLFLLTGRDAA